MARGPPAGTQISWRRKYGDDIDANRRRQRFSCLLFAIAFDILFYAWRRKASNHSHSARPVFAMVFDRREEHRGFRIVATPYDFVAPAHRHAQDMAAGRRRATGKDSPRGLACGKKRRRCCNVTPGPHRHVIDYARQLSDVAKGLQKNSHLTEVTLPGGDQPSELAVTTEQTKPDYATNSGTLSRPPSPIVVAKAILTLALADGAAFMRSARSLSQTNHDAPLLLNNIELS